MLAFVSQELMSKAREWWVAQHGKTNWKKWSADEYNCILIPAYEKHISEAQAQA